MTTEQETTDQQWPDSGYLDLHVLTLPSGKRVRVQRASLLDQLGAGGIPTQFTSAVWRMVNGAGEANITKPDDMKFLSTLVEALVVLSLKSPVISDETHVRLDEHGIWTGTLRYRDLRDPDRLAIFGFANGDLSDDELAALKAGQKQEVDAAKLSSFPDHPAGDDAGPDGEAVRTEAVEPAGAATP